MKTPDRAILLNSPSNEAPPAYASKPKWKRRLGLAEDIPYCRPQSLFDTVDADDDNPEIFSGSSLKDRRMSMSMLQRAYGMI